ncbi:MAG: transaldolase [Campylobacteraceae bacterium]|nr:transaldolase [Campylobacteraceae bacterium]
MYLTDVNFSLWCDFVEKRFLDGEFLELIKNGKINGATSNPAIFKTAFLTSPAYKEAKASLVGKPSKEIYEALAVADIKHAADALLPLYEVNDDGFISIEVDPFLSDDEDGTVREGRRLVELINRPNVMIKVPATKAGIKAMQTLMSEGIHINATLVFSPKQAKDCLEAFSGATSLFKGVAPKGVISVFVSRFDRKLDDLMVEKGLPKSRVGIMNAAVIYREIEEANLPNVRCLFASTGVKDKELDSSYYIEELLFPRAINTAPLETINDFLKKDIKQRVACPDNIALKQFFRSINDAGIDMEKIYGELFKEGIESFHEAFKEILESF